MKLIAVIFAFIATMAFAEPTFEQVENLIEQKNYSAAVQGLEVVLKNHPNSAKAFYAMAQAQAGLGNLEKARYALDKATGLDPDLKFASKSNVENLRAAVTPQIAKIEKVEESHFWRNLFIFLILCGGGFATWWYFFRRKDSDDKLGGGAPRPAPFTPPPSHTAAAKPETQPPKAETQEAKPETAQAKVDTPKPESVTKPSTIGQAIGAQGAAQAPVSYQYTQPAPAPQVIHTHSSDNGMGNLAMGMMLGNMMSSSHHQPERTKVIEREVIREVPAREERREETRSSSWDSAPTETRSSSWDSGSSSTSSSWDSDSSSSRSSSWSSSSDSSSSSSWDSGSSSSDSSSSSSDW